jgi:hypothetical protein
MIAYCHITNLSLHYARFSKWILIVLTLLALLVSASLMAFPGSNEAAEIFNCSHTILPFLAALVLGFYFGRINP